MTDNIDKALDKIADLGKENFRCPRCGGYIPNDENPGAYPGALSRCTRGDEDPIYVCSACGTDEAMMQFTTGQCQIPAEWPVTRQFDMPNPEDIAEAFETAQKKLPPELQ